jgi:cytoskeleton protein RodZ
MSEESLPLPEKNYGPGNVLRAKREEYEWSVEAVAEALHLSTHSVKAIEGDRYDELPGATYVVGYWRSYARLLDIDIEETIEVNKRNLNIITAETTGVDINRSYGQQEKRSSKLGLLLLILLVGFAYYAWQQQFFGLLDGLINTEENLRLSDSASSQNAGNAVTTPAEKKPAQVLRPLKPQTAELDEAQLKRVEAVSAASQPAVGEAPMPSGQTDSGLALQPTEATNPDAMQSAPPTAQSGLVLAQDAVSSSADSGQSNVQNNIPQDKLDQKESDASTSAETPVEARPDQAGTAKLAPGMETMTLTINKDSWLDIRDKTRKRLLYETAKAGQKIDVSGMPPFYVYIGTPDGVTIQYQGKPVQFETHKTGMFARFKLDDKMLEAL